MDLPTIPFTDRVGLTPDAHRELFETVQAHRGMDDVIGWAARLTPPAEVLEVVVQDEYSHDYVLRLREGLFLVYGST